MAALPELQVRAVDLCLEENQRSHHTSAYESRELVVRRGQPVALLVHLSRPLHAATDRLAAELSLGPRPSAERGTLHRLALRREEGGGRWALRLRSAHQASLSLLLRTSARAPLGLWSLRLSASSATDDRPHRPTQTSQLVLVCNPWCPEDDVFVADAEERRAFVLAQTGCLWTGGPSPRPPYFHAQPTEWLFGQMEEATLLAALRCLSEVKSDAPLRPGDVAAVSRHLAHAVNSAVLRGCWDFGDAEEELIRSGKARRPSHWHGTVPILRQWLTGNTYEQVRYGQCWVFAGVLTSLCRALGIPCRPVTCVRAAHDADSDLVVERHFDLDSLTGRLSPRPDAPNDSVWNFHVWVEAYFRRPDLGPELQGWQVLDATPQEPSGGLYRCGPVPVEAIRRGRLATPHDAAFVFAQVNADVVTKVYSTDPLRPHRSNLVQRTRDPYDVGRAIVTSETSRPWELRNITAHYKPPDGSSEERTLMKEALRRHLEAERDESEEEAVGGPEDVVFRLDDLSVVELGQPVISHLSVTNTAHQPRTIKAVLRLCVESAEGRSRAVVEARVEAGLAGRTSRRWALLGTAAEVAGQLRGDDQPLVHASASVAETRQAFRQSDAFRIVRPRLEVEGRREGRVGEPSVLRIRLRNPLPVPLSDCRLSLETLNGTAFSLGELCPESLPGLGSHEARVALVPRRSGPAALSLLLSAQEIPPLHGSFHLFALP